ncbi:hypothetical protein D5086_002210, partial [Populus alba]
QGKKLHAHLIINGLARLTHFASKLISFYVETRQLSDARKLFDKIPESNIRRWIVLIGAYSRRGLIQEALSVFSEMQKQGLGANKFVIPSVLKCCGHVYDVQTGRILHSVILKYSIESDVYVISSLIDMYSKCGEVEKARRVFDRMVEKDLVALNAMLSGLVQNFRNEAAFDAFKQMLGQGFLPTSATISTVLAACATMANVRRGREIHGYAVVIRVEDDIYVRSALVDMYAKCGFISEASMLFYMMPERNTVTWNSMIFGYANHGYCDEAIELFDQMEKSEGNKLDHLTFTAVLTACSHAGMVEHGQSLLLLMQQKYKIVPRLEHYACMVDLLGRAGNLNEAYDMIKKMPVKPDLFVWGALLGA